MAPGTAKVLPYSLEFLAAVAAYVFTHGGITRDVYIEHVADTAHIPHLPYILSNISLPTPHCGHTQSSGRAENSVPGLILGASPTSGSYIYPQTIQRYFCNSTTSLSLFYIAGCCLGRCATFYLVVIGISHTRLIS